MNRQCHSLYMPKWFDGQTIVPADVFAVACLM